MFVTYESQSFLIKYENSYNYVIANTLHPHKNSRITAWHSPNELVHNQIYYILKPQRFKSNIILSSTITYLGAYINSDHDLIMLNLKLTVRSNKPHKNKRICSTLNKLKDPSICKVNSEHLDVKCNELEKTIKDGDPTEI